MSYYTNPAQSGTTSSYSSQFSSSPYQSLFEKAKAKALVAAQEMDPEKRVSMSRGTEGRPDFYMSGGGGFVTPADPWELNQGLDKTGAFL